MLHSILRWLSRQPLRSLHLWGVAAGWLTYALSPTYRRRFVANAEGAGLSAAQWRPAIAAAGSMVLELPFLWLRPPGVPISPLVRWHGAELIDAALEAAQARGHGVIFLTPHLGAFEVTAQAYAERFGARNPMTVLYRPARKPWLRRVVEASRSRAGLSSAPATLAGVRQMMRALQRGEAVGLLPDQVPPYGMGVWAPFFGRPAYTMTLPARLQQASGAALVFCYARRLPRGRGYELHLSELEEPLSRNRREAATQVNRMIERLIRACPEQYLWCYNRYKRPPKAPPPPAAQGAT
jgi:Kdo2-lipid IVA lauroyltransferase/acyltransferase